MNPTLYYPITNWPAPLARSRLLPTSRPNQGPELHFKFGSTGPTRMMVGQSLGTIWKQMRNSLGTKGLWEGSGLWWTQFRRNLVQITWVWKMLGSSDEPRYRESGVQDHGVVHPIQDHRRAAHVRARGPGSGTSLPGIVQPTLSICTSLGIDEGWLSVL